MQYILKIEKFLDKSSFLFYFILFYFICFFEYLILWFGVTVYFLLELNFAIFPNLQILII